MLRLSRTLLEKRGQNFGAGKILPKKPIFQKVRNWFENPIST
jgi:hypothetical protein